MAARGVRKNETMYHFPNFKEYCVQNIMPVGLVKKKKKDINISTNNIDIH